MKIGLNALIDHSIHVTDIKKINNLVNYLLKIYNSYLINERIMQESSHH